MRCHVRISEALDGIAFGQSVHTHSHFAPASLTIGHQSFWSASMKRMTSAVGIGRKGVPVLFKASLQVRILQRLEEVLPQLVNDRLRRPLGGDERLTSRPP